MITAEINNFFETQLDHWPLAKTNYDALRSMETKKVTVKGIPFDVMFNPARITSSGAKTDAKSIGSRPCFLCEKNRPAEQMAYPILGGYSLLVNPFPIFDKHFTIASDTHRPQTVMGADPDGMSRIVNMMRIAMKMPGYTVFYNGPFCGASAPDHLHFQAVPTESLPLLWKRNTLPYESVVYRDKNIHTLNPLLKSVVDDYATMPENIGLNEPRFNVFMRSLNDGFEVKFIPRRAHRPLCYGRGEGQMLISPGAIDVAGAVVTCRKEDFDNLDSQKLTNILQQVVWMPKG